MVNFYKLRDIREDYDITQREMANILKVNRSTYSLWELSLNIIPISNLYDFADYFNISIDYIFGLTNNKRAKRKYKGLNLQRLGNNLKIVRIKNQLSQENIAEILGVTQACISKFEKGIVCISTINLYKFCREFNVSLDSILGQDRSSKINYRNVEEDTYLNV